MSFIILMVVMLLLYSLCPQIIVILAFSSFPKILVILTSRSTFLSSSYIPISLFPPCFLCVYLFHLFLIPVCEAKVISKLK
jgi:hypothetical protein